MMSSINYSLAFYASGFSVPLIILHFFSLLPNVFNVHQFSLLHGRGIKQLVMLHSYNPLSTLSENTKKGVTDV